MEKKYLTLEDLYSFYFNMNKTCHFSSKENDGPIVVQEPGIFASDTSSFKGLLPVDIMSCHINLNRNGSYISKENMEKAIPSIYNRPILGNIIQLDDGTYDFHSHDYTIDEDGNAFYIERPIGVIPESGNAHLEYDEENDKTYVRVKGFIYEDYGNQAADIIRNKESNKVSVELIIEELSYNAEEKRLELDDFYFNGITCLGKEKNGTEIREGMKGANLKLSDFSVKNNSIVQNLYENKLLETLDKLNTTLSNFQIDTNSKEGGKGPVKLQELLEKFNKTMEDIDFEVDGLSDEELEVKFEDKFATPSKDHKEDPGQEDPEGDPKPEEDEACKKKKKCSVEINDKKYDYAVSLDETIYAIETVINDTYAEADNAYYAAKVYDKYVVMVDIFSGRAYKQSYKARNGVYSLTGDRVEVYSRYLTKEEDSALDEMRSKYSDMESQLQSYINKENSEKKNTILNSSDYEQIKDSEKFKAFVEDVTLEGNELKYSVEDVQTECDKMLLDYVKANNNNFASSKPRAKTVKTNVEKPNEYKPYGSLFDNI